jgi:hypothetical protein
MRHVAPKRRLSRNGLHGVASQRTEHFIISNGMLQMTSVFDTMWRLNNTEA